MERQNNPFFFGQWWRTHEKKQLHPKKKINCISFPFFSVLVIVMKHSSAREAWTKTVGQEDSLQEKLWVTVVLNDIFDILCF